MSTLSDAERTPCEIWTRCMGYFRPISFFNIGKQAEHRERLYFTERPTGVQRPSHRAAATATAP